jgi:uncharacterized SAM-binding protein YcdF (DUF218 family)
MRWFLTLILAALALWGAAFAVFMAAMYVPPASTDQPTDALIVLTGGNGRVERGLSLLADGAAPVLFISGVGEKVTLMEMLAAHASRETREKILHNGSEIIFDYAASSTQTNAAQAAEFVRDRHYQSIRLITGHYHMPRSMVEFHAALPGVTILREPVVPNKLARTPWWRDPAGRRLIWQEFHKYLAASFRVLWQRT